jgi:hypothetical protein
MQSEKIMRCTRCGHESKQVTNHTGPTWSWGKVNCCPNCPPWAKYPEFGGRTDWEYVSTVVPVDETEINNDTDSRFSTDRDE